MSVMHAHEMEFEFALGAYVEVADDDDADDGYIATAVAC